MTDTTIIQSRFRIPAVAAVVAVLLASLSVGAVPAAADDHGHDHDRHDYRRDDHRGHPGGWTGGYYQPPPVVYGSPYYAPPPVVYGPGISVNLPGVSIGVR